MKKIVLVVLILCGLSYSNAQEMYIPDPIEIDGQTIQPDTLWYKYIENSGNEVYIEIIPYMYVGKVGVNYEDYIYIPDSIDGIPVKSIQSQTFLNCKNIRSIRLPNLLSCINSETFEGCRGITSITIPYGVTTIGFDAFENSTLETIEIPNSVTSIGDYAFYQSELKSIKIPNSIISLGLRAFMYCPLTSIIVEDGNKYYDSRNNCNAIIETASNKLIIGCENTTIPNGITSIEEYAFIHCTKLTSIKIPNSVTSIGRAAFASCGLISIDLPESVISIDDIAFLNCQQLLTINVDNNNSFYDSRNNCNAIIKTNTNTLIVGCNNTFIPHTIQTIGEKAFSNCLLDTLICLSKNPPIIKTLAFSGIPSQSKLHVPNNVLDLYINDSAWTNSFSEIKGIINEEFDKSNNDSTVTISWNPIPNTTDYHILILDSVNTDTIGEFWFDSIGNNVTEYSISKRNIIRHMPMEGSKDVFTLKLKVGDGSTNTPSAEQTADMPAGQRKLLIYGMKYNYELSGKDKDNNETFYVTSSFNVKENPTDDLDMIYFNENPRTRKIMENGQIIIVTPENKYDLKGTRLK